MSRLLIATTKAHGISFAAAKSFEINELWCFPPFFGVLFSGKEGWGSINSITRPRSAIERGASEMALFATG